MKKLIGLLLVVILLGTFSFIGCSSETETPASPTETSQATAVTDTTTATTTDTATATTIASASEPIVIRCMTLTRHTQELDSWSTYENMLNTINEACNGELIMEDVGGPDSIPAESQPEALRSGIIDFIQSGSGWVSNFVPELELIDVSPLSTEEEMSSGFINLLDEFCIEQNLFLLGRNPKNRNQECIVLRDHMSETPSDLEGLRCAGLNQGNMTAAQVLGMDYLNIERADRYTSLEKGLVDALIISPGAAGYLSLQEIADYYIKHTFYRADSIFIFNNETFSGLPEHLQAKIVDAYIAGIPKAVALYDKVDKVSEDKFIDGGVTGITYSAEDEAYFSNTVWEANAERILAKFPEIVDQVYEVWGK